MKCIDAIEGTAKKIISQMHAVFIDDCLDDSEFIRNIKAVIEATDQFLQDNPELIEDRQLLKQVLYSYLSVAGIPFTPNKELSCRAASMILATFHSTSPIR